MNQCKTCKLWVPFDPPEHTRPLVNGGHCTNVPWGEVRGEGNDWRSRKLEVIADCMNDAHPTIPSTGAVAYGYEGTKLYLLTGPEFGCVNWQGPVYRNSTGEPFGPQPEME